MYLGNLHENTNAYEEERRRRKRRERKKGGARLMATSAIISANHRLISLISSPGASISLLLVREKQVDFSKVCTNRVKRDRINSSGFCKTDLGLCIDALDDFP